ncbi:unnamed protein product [Cylindrotheca closterium]|uniref:Pseudouridine synthase I TruA alpha/beta domain-containing protein n=1 Tax=Cylindrotheca closterium TaxID=2856 RepID=A0AAD2GBZ4_9STRA|nr:unnamed protein product [Cylindrotheca closterium]
MSHTKHAVLKELKIDGDSQASSADILNYLLKTKRLSEDTVRLAVEKVSQKTASNPPNTSPPRNTHAPAIEQRTRHVALRFYYDGADYNGLSQNLGQDTDNSIEKELFQALIKARLVDSRDSCGYSRCGRTDRGVSSVGQVVALRLKSSIPAYATFDQEGTKPVPNEELPKNEFSKISAWVYPRKKKQVDTSAPRVQKEIAEYAYSKILNNLLPVKIRILGWSPVSDEFSARFSCSSRTYRYFFAKRQMNLERIREGLAFMVGKHDFRNFCKMDVEKVYNFERHIYDAKLAELGNGICYVQIHGQAFLWHQIRYIMAVLFMIGRGLEKADIVPELLNVTKYPGKPSYRLAEDTPLVLHDCGYPNLKIGYSVPNLWTTTCQLEKEWEDLMLAANQIRNCLDSLRDVEVQKADVEDFAKNRAAERQKKLERVGKSYSGGNESTLDWDQLSDSPLVKWEEALLWMDNRMGLVADPGALDTHIHIPLMSRSFGTTYEEKLEQLKLNDRKRKKYEDGVVKKRLATEEDKRFYQHMARQGGAGI